MASVIHIAEVAAILAVAYALGWVVGYAAHRLVARPSAGASIPAERVAAVTAAPAADALVKAPVIEPVPGSLPPAPAPVAVPQPEPDAPIEPVPPAEAADTAEPVVAAPEPAAEPLAGAPGAELAEADVSSPAPVAEAVPTAMPAVRPGEAWSGHVRGRAAAERIAAAPVEPAAEPAPPLDVPLTIDLGPVGPDSIYGAPVVPEPIPAPAAVDEDAAMRAIEGGWSRTGATALPDAPELSDVGAAVAAAQSAVEQVLAQAGIEAKPAIQTSRPPGLPRPRHGGRDDLKRIEGLGALDESTLNNLGVFHFDQIAGWSEAEVLWMENHVFARGRIGREAWQRQARDLGASAA